MPIGKDRRHPITGRDHHSYSWSVFVVVVAAVAASCLVVATVEYTFVNRNTLAWFVPSTNWFGPSIHVPGECVDALARVLVLASSESFLSP